MGSVPWACSITALALAYLALAYLSLAPRYTGGRRLPALDAWGGSAPTTLMANLAAGRVWPATRSPGPDAPGFVVMALAAGRCASAGSVAPAVPGMAGAGWSWSMPQAQAWCQPGSSSPTQALVALCRHTTAGKESGGDCFDGLDNDCDGLVSGCVRGATVMCASACGAHSSVRPAGWAGLQPHASMCAAGCTVSVGYAAGGGCELCEKGGGEGNHSHRFSTECICPA